MKEDNVPQTSTSGGNFSYSGPCPAAGTPNFLCAHWFAMADMVGARLALHAEARLKRTNANGLLAQELVYASARVFVAQIGTSTSAPVGTAYFNFALTGFRSQSASDASLLPEAYATASLNGLPIECSADSCPPVPVPGWNGQVFTVTLRADARVTNPQPTVLTGWDADMVADFSDTLELVAIELRDTDGHPMPDAQVWVEDGFGNRLFDIPTSVGSTTSSTVTTSTSTSVTTTSTAPVGATTTIATGTTTSQHAPVRGPCVGVTSFTGVQCVCDQGITPAACATDHVPAVVPRLFHKACGAMAHAATLTAQTKNKKVKALVHGATGNLERALGKDREGGEETQADGAVQRGRLAYPQRRTTASTRDRK